MMNQTTKNAWLKKDNLTPQEMEARKRITKKLFRFVLLPVFVLVIVLMVAVAPKDAPPKTQEQIRKELIEKQFDKWDGAHIKLKQLVKRSMNDPKSFENVQTRYNDNGDHLILHMVFRGKNAFGGVVTHRAYAEADINTGEILSIEIK